MTEIKQDEKKVDNYLQFLQLPLKMVGCWDWFEKPTTVYHVFINNIYLGLVLFVLVNLPISLIVHLYTEWVDLFSNLDKIADGLPLLASLAIVSYFAVHKKELYELVQFMNDNFRWRSARGLTNMTMLGSYRMARMFAYCYTSSTVFCVAIYVFLPVLVHLWTKEPLEPWIYLDATSTPFIVLLFLRQCLAQAFVALAMGQLGVFYVSTSILLCGQLDVLCCSLRNARSTALLARGVPHHALLGLLAPAHRHHHTLEDEQHSYLYNTARMTDSEYHYDMKITNTSTNMKIKFDMYSSEYEAATVRALRDCARVLQAVTALKDRFERLVSPLLVLRIAQVTLYHCTLLYAVTLISFKFMWDYTTSTSFRLKKESSKSVYPVQSSEKFDMITVEYLAAVVLDIFIYCYFGSQIILQAERVSMAAYQSEWVAGGVGARRALLALLRGAQRPLAVRAARWLPMHLQTFLVIIKTSFSYYTLLVSVNEK